MTRQFIKTKHLFFIYAFYLLLFFPLWQNGELYYDDWSIAETGNLKNLTGAIKGYLNGFITRPIAAIFLGIFSQINHNFQLIFFINVSIWFLFCLIVSNIFSKLVNKNFSIALFLLLLFPSFCITNLISPYAQSLGTISIFLWSISFFFSYKYFFNKKKINIVYAVIFFFASVLTYETSFTLIVLNFLIKYFYENKQIKINLELIFSNSKEIFFLFSVTLIIIIYQKIIVNYLPFEISNRYRFSFSKDFFIILFENKFYPFLLLFDSLKLLFKAFLRIFDIGFYILPLILIFFVSLKNEIKVKLNTNYIINFFIFYFLFILFFIIASSKPTIYGYYNRAMSGYNFIFFLTLLSLIIIIIKNTNLRKIIITLLISLNFLSFFIQIQNHSKASTKRTLIVKEIIKVIDKDKKNIFVFSIVPTEIKNNFNGEFIFSEEVLDFERTLKFYSKNRINGKRIYKYDNCSKVLKFENNKFIFFVPSRSKKIKELMQDQIQDTYDHYFIFDNKNNIIFKIDIENLQTILINRNICNSI